MRGLSDWDSPRAVSRPPQREYETGVSRVNGTAA